MIKNFGLLKVLGISVEMTIFVQNLNLDIQKQAGKIREMFYFIVIISLPVMTVQKGEKIKGLVNSIYNHVLV